MVRIAAVALVLLIFTLVFIGVYLALERWYPDALTQIFNIHRARATMIKVGAACIDCHASIVTHVVTGAHSEVSCDTCHQGIDAHRAVPEDPNKIPKAVFASENCSACHGDMYEQWKEYYMEELPGPPVEPEPGTTGTQNSTNTREYAAAEKPGLTQETEAAQNDNVTKEVNVTPEVTVVKEVEVTVTPEAEVPVYLSDWTSPEELKSFLEQDNSDKHVYFKADAVGVVKFADQCEDLAFQLRDRAMEKSKYLSVISLSPDEYRKWYGQSVPKNVYHAICMARIGNEFWYIEPTNDRAWLALYLD